MDLSEPDNESKISDTNIQTSDDNDLSDDENNSEVIDDKCKCKMNLS